MFHLVVAAGFEYVVKTDKVAFDVGIGVGDAVAYASLCGKVYHHRDVMLGKHLFYSLFVGYRGVHKGPVAVKCLNLFQPLMLDAHIIVICYAVNANHLDALHIVKQALHQIAANKACCTRYEHGFALEGYVIFYHRA